MIKFFDKIFKKNHCKISADSILTENAKDASNEVRDVMQKLDELVGLEQFKDVIKISVGEKIISNESIPGHYVFLGNPGTGKSEAAKKWVKYLRLWVFYLMVWLLQSPRLI